MRWETSFLFTQDKEVGDATNTEDSSDQYSSADGEYHSSNTSNTNNLFVITRNCAVTLLWNFTITEWGAGYSSGILNSWCAAEVFCWSPLYTGNDQSKQGERRRQSPTIHIEGPSLPGKQLLWISECRSFLIQETSRGSSVLMKFPIKKQQHRIWLLVLIYCQD